MKVKTIHCVSRASVKVRDSFYTVEYGEDRELDEMDDVVAERESLWNDCNAEVDNQLQEIKDMLLK